MSALLIILRKEDEQKYLLNEVWKLGLEILLAT